jgi:hypothetical protein
VASAKERGKANATLQFGHDLEVVETRIGVSRSSSLTTFLAEVMSLKSVLPKIWPKRMFKTFAKRVFRPDEISVQGRELKNVYQLNVENGMAASFWIRHEIFQGSGTDIRVKSVNEQMSGPLSGSPPTYGDGKVIVDVYSDGLLSGSHIELPNAADPGFQIVAPPSWWKTNSPDTPWRSWMSNSATP